MHEIKEQIVELIRVSNPEKQLAIIKNLIEEHKEISNLKEIMKYVVEDEVVKGYIFDRIEEQKIAKNIRNNLLDEEELKYEIKKALYMLTEYKNIEKANENFKLIESEFENIYKKLDLSSLNRDIESKQYIIDKYKQEDIIFRIVKDSDFIKNIQKKEFILNSKDFKENYSEFIEYLETQLPEMKGKRILTDYEVFFHGTPYKFDKLKTQYEMDNRTSTLELDGIHFGSIDVALEYATGKREALEESTCQVFSTFIIEDKNIEKEYTEEYLDELYEIESIKYKEFCEYYNIEELNEEQEKKLREEVDLAMEDYKNLQKYKFETVVKKVGEEIGFGQGVNYELSGIEDNQVLFIENADTGAYFSDELVVKNLDNLLCFNEEKWNETYLEFLIYKTKNMIQEDFSKIELIEVDALKSKTNLKHKYKNKNCLTKI